MRHLSAAAFAAVFVFGAAAARADCPPQYISGSTPIQTGGCGPVVYNGSGSATLTLPTVAWAGHIINSGSASLTIIGASNAPVNGGASVAIGSGSGGSVSGDPSAGWWIVLGAGASGGGSGTVRSVGMTAPAWLSVGGSPVTTSGTITLTGVSESANQVLASPIGSSGVPGFRALVAGDIPSLSSLYNGIITWPTASDLMLSNGGDAPTAYAGFACTNQVLTALAATGAGTCSSVTAAYLSGAITAAEMLPLPSAEIYVGAAGGAPAAVALSGDCTMANTGAITCTKSSGTAFGTAAFDNTGTAGATIPLLNGNWTASGNVAFSGGITASGLTAGTQVSCLGLTAGNAVALSTGACGSGGGSTTITLGPGLGNSQTSFNGTASPQTVTNGSTAYTQLGSIAKSGSYTLNADCSGGALCDTARLILSNAASLTFTAPNPAGTLAPYQIADEGGHSFTVATAGGTATFTGCVAGAPTSLTVPANYAAQLFDQGSGANAYYCVLQYTGSVHPVANGGTGAATLTAHGILLGEGTSAVGSVGSGSTADSVPLWGGAGGDPTAAALGSCSGASNALTYNTSTHAFGCNTISGGGSSIGTGYYTGANYYYLPLGLNNQIAGGAVAANTIYCSSGTTLNSITLEALVMDITTIDATPGHAQLAVYDNTGTGHRPGALLFNTASISEATSGMTSAAVTSGSLPAGGYWFCINQDGTTAKYEVNSNSSTTNALPSVFVGSATLANMAPGAAITGISTPETFGTWPSLAGATWTDQASLRTPVEWVQAQ